MGKRSEEAHVEPLLMENKYDGARLFQAGLFYENQPLLSEGII